MADALTILEEAEGVAVLTLARPEKRNARSGALRDELVARLDALAARATTRAVVLTGAPPAFCAGFDRSEFSGGEMAEVFAEATEYHHRVYTFSKPLIAAVHGPAPGGGGDLAAMCDLRLAATTALFVQPPARFGSAAAYDLRRVGFGAGAAPCATPVGRSSAS